LVIGFEGEWPIQLVAAQFSHRMQDVYRPELAANSVMIDADG